MATPTVLITGFEPYGPWTLNPSGAVAEQLDGSCIDGASIVARTLPVTLASLADAVSALVQQVNPDVVISLGLAPGAATLRVERVGLNLADFALPDNAGLHVRNARLVPEGPQALCSTLAVRDIQAAQARAGIPSVVSNSAGTYLCNAVLYSFLHAAHVQTTHARCGFIHLPFLPSQVAQQLSAVNDSSSGAAPGVENLASMSLDDMIKGVAMAVSISVKTDVASP